MKKIQGVSSHNKALALSSIYLGALLFGCGKQDNTTSPDRDAASSTPTDPITARARQEIEAKLYKSNGSWYGFQLNLFGGLPDALVQMKGLSINAHSFDLTAADNANGIQWRGFVKIESEVYRIVSVSSSYETKEVKVVGKWSDWQNGTPQETPVGKIGGGVPVFNGHTLRGHGQLDLTVRNDKWEWSVTDAPKPNPTIIPKD